MQLRDLVIESLRKTNGITLVEAPNSAQTQTATGASTSSNSVIVKYDTSGNALWARTTNTASNTSMFQAIATDNSGNVYAVGYQLSNGTFTYGTQTVQGASSAGKNSALLKYDSTGNTLWGRSVSIGASGSEFDGVAPDSSGNIYTVGYQSNTDTYTYGGETATGTYSAENVVIVKYR
ncbi:MAG: hypothetical protein JSR44_15570 [Spirochaetes bacterium]|nr:hypothetical protein [Spirochaetota bacterium]